LKRLTRGFEVNEETLAVDLIDSIGPGGFFTADRHTVDHFRNEQWEPGMWSREMLQKWLAGGGKADEARALDLWRDIMATPDDEHCISDELERALRGVIKKVRSKLL